MTDPFESFALLAELAIALAGFGGVAAAFGGRERRFQPTERIRLQALFMDSALVLVGCALLDGSHSAGLSTSSASLTASAIVLCLEVLTSASTIATAFRVAREPDSTTEWWSLYASVVAMASVAILLALDLFLGGRLWPLVAGFWILLLHGLWMFTRILTRPN